MKTNKPCASRDFERITLRVVFVGRMITAWIADIDRTRGESSSGAASVP